MHFSEHGEVAVQDEFPLLVTYVHGPWNRELVQQWAATALPYAKTYAERGPWVGMAVISGSMLCTANALELHREIATHLVRELGAVAAVHVASAGTEGEQLMRGVFAALFDGLCPYGHFGSQDEAKAWSNDQVAQALGRLKLARVDQ